MSLLSWKIPLRVISRIRSKILDWVYSGESLGGAIKPSAPGAHTTSSTDYAILSDVFNRVNIKNSDVLVDVGCGKGRVIFWWLKSGFTNKMYGIELNDDVAKETQRRLQKYSNVSIISGSVLEHIPDDATVFYLFNPFDKEITKSFRERLESSFRNKKILIIYYNCDHVDVFENNPKWHVDTQEVNLLASGISGAKVAFITNTTDEV